MYRKLLVALIFTLMLSLSQYNYFAFSQDDIQSEHIEIDSTVEDSQNVVDKLIVRDAEGTHELKITSKNSDSKNEQSHSLVMSSLNWLYDVFKNTVIPLIAVFLSYYLLKKRETKRESNILFIKLELLLRELRQHMEQISSIDERFISAINARNNIALSLYGFKDSIYKVLSELEKLSEDYMYDRFTTTKDKPYGLMYDKSNDLIRLGFEIKNLKKELEEYEERYNRMPDSGVNSKHKEEIFDTICILKDKIEVNSKKFIGSRTVYDDIKSIYSKIEDNLFLKLADKEPFGESFKYIHNQLYEYVSKESVDKVTAGKLFYDLMLNRLEYFSGPDPLFPDSDVENHKLFDLWRDYYIYKNELEKIKAINLDFASNQWSINKWDLVLIHKKDIYIKILDYYENNQLLVKLQTGLIQDFSNFYNEDIEQHYRNFVKENIEKLINELLSIESELLNIQNKLIKKC